MIHCSYFLALTKVRIFAVVPKSVIKIVLSSGDNIVQDYKVHLVEY